MAAQGRNKRRDQVQTIVLITLPLLLVAYGWFNVYNLASNLEDNTIKTYQEAQLEVVDNAANAAQIYIQNELTDIRDQVRSEQETQGVAEDEIAAAEAAAVEAAIPEIEIEVLNQYVVPIKIGNVGDAWIYAPDHIVFDPSPDFPPEYIGKSMAEIFEIQKANGAFHYEAMTESVVSASREFQQFDDGNCCTGWYVWEPEKAVEATPLWEFITDDSGREIAAWTGFKVFEGEPSEETWVIGMSAMLPELMTENGAYNDIQNAMTQMVIITIAVLVLMTSLWRAETQVKELREQVRELRVEIDEGKRAQQVSEIVDSEYFQGLAERAKELRERHKK